MVLDRALIDLEHLDELVDRNSRRVTGHKFCDLGFVQPPAEALRGSSNSLRNTQGNQFEQGLDAFPEVQDMTVTLITGGNKGLGYETARQLIEHGHTVYVGARHIERGQAAASELGGQFVQLDVTADTVSGGRPRHYRRARGPLRRARQ